MFAYTGLITMHAIGLSLAVGFSWVLALRVLGVGRSMPLDAMDRLFRVVWIGFWLCAASGTLLAVGHATTDLTSPIFFIKLGLIAVAITRTRRLETTWLTGPSPRLAGAVIAVWVGAIIAGRLNEYPSLFGMETHP